MTPIQSDIFTSLRAFIQSLITTEVIQGLGNGTPMPLGSFICMTAINQSRLATNIDFYNDLKPLIGTKSIQQQTKYTIQIDCYGPLSSDWANTLSAVFRDEYACIALAPNIQPLYSDDPVMSPLIDGEQQYEQRWIVNAALQYNPVILTPMQFADVINITNTISI